MATLYSMDCFSLDPSSSSIDEIMLSWHHLRGTILFLLSTTNNQLLPKLTNSSCHCQIALLSKPPPFFFSSPYMLTCFTFAVCLDLASLKFFQNECRFLIILHILLLSDVEGATACEDSTVVYINKLEELPLTICRLNRKVRIEL